MLPLDHSGGPFRIVTSSFITMPGKGDVTSSTRPDRGALRNWVVCGDKEKLKMNLSREMLKLDNLDVQRIRLKN